jgi:hypothetical protein
VLAVDHDGRVVAVCRAAGGVLHPRKVLVERATGAGTGRQREVGRHADPGPQPEAV